MAASLCMNAADVYVTPEGNGTKDGTTRENAMGLTEYNALMKFKSVSDATGKFDETTFKFAAGEYIITSTSFVYRSGITVEGSYDPATGQKSATERTIFNGNNKERSNDAFFLQPESKMDGTNGTRKVSISGIDFENFVCTNVWRNGDTNWQYGLPSTIYITRCGEAKITDCKLTATNAPQPAHSPTKTTTSRPTRKRWPVQSRLTAAIYY